MFNLLHMSGLIHNVFRAVVSATVTVLTAVIRFTVRLKAILNGFLTWVANAFKAIGSYLNVVRLWFSQARSRISCAWRCLTTHPLLYNQRCLCQGKAPSKKRKRASKKWLSCMTTTLLTLVTLARQWPLRSARSMGLTISSSLRIIDQRISLI